MRADTLRAEKRADAEIGASAPGVSYTVFDGLQWTSSRGLARFARQLRRHIDAAGWQELPSAYPKWNSGMGRVLIAEMIEPLQQLKLRPEIAFYPHNILPSWLPTRASLRVLVVHDVLFLKDENGRSAGNRYRRLKLRHSLGNADLILTVSEASCTEIRRLLRREVKVLVLPNCLAEPFARLGPATRHAPGATPTILHFGGHTPSKNTRTVIQAVAQIVRGGMDVRLEVAAMSGQAALLEGWRVAAGLPDRALCVLPLLSDAELIAAYRRADLHAMPSTGEGFGIPVIEAARAGAINVLTPLDVFREVMQDAAIHATGFDADAVASALRVGFAIDRSALVERAFVRSESYTFEAIHRLYAEPALDHIAQLDRARASGERA